RATQGEDDHPRSSVRTRGVPRIHLVKVGAVASLPHGKRELSAARGCRWPCDLHPARALGCGSGSRHTAYRRPLFGAGIGDRDGLGIDHSGRDTEAFRHPEVDAKSACARCRRSRATKRMSAAIMPIVAAYAATMKTACGPRSMSGSALRL